MSITDTSGAPLEGNGTGQNEARSSPAEMAGNAIQTVKQEAASFAELLRSSIAEREIADAK